MRLSLLLLGLSESHTGNQFDLSLTFFNYFEGLGGIFCITEVLNVHVLLYMGTPWAH